MRVSRRSLCLGTIASVAVSQTQAQSEPGAPASIPERIDDYLTRLSGFSYSGATLLVKDGQVLVRKGYGLANDADGVPVSPDTIFDVGSHAKTFTAGVMLRLAAQGRVQLSDPITRFLPGVPEDKRAITIEHLLSHTAGLDSEFPFVEPTGEYYEEVSRDEAVRRILATPLIDTPGNDFSYSNMGFVLAAAIVESAAEQPFRDFVRAEIFAPIGMTSTGFWGGLANVPDARLARSYDDTAETANLRDRSGTTWMDLGGGEVVSTVDDLYAWMQALRVGGFLPAELRDRMWTPVKGNYGLGWFIEPTGPGGRRIHHGGDYVGFGCELAYYPEHDLVLANLANRRKDVIGMRYAADRVVPLLALGQPLRLWPGQAFDTFDEPPRWSTRDAARLDAAVGTYRLSSGGDVIVTRQDGGGVRISARGQDAVDAIHPASAAERTVRARSTERAIALMRAAFAGDRAVLEATLRHGAPIEEYQRNLARYESSAEFGRLLSIEAVGTAPWNFPVGSRLTSLKLSYERGATYLRFGWDARQDRIIYWGLEGPESFGSIPLRAGRNADIVGWDIVTGRAIRLRPRGPSRQPRRIEIESSDGAHVSAVRTA